MIDKKGKTIPFKRYIDKDATSKKWDEPLVDHAYEGKGTYIGSFVSSNEGKDWYEVVNADSSEGYTRYYLIPVDEYGNKLTGKQIEKKFPYKAESWKRNLERYGYATYRDIDRDEDFEWLIAGTDQVEQYDRYGNVDWDNDKVRTLYKGDNKISFDDIDDWGRPTPVDQFLAEHPDFDPDIDEIPLAYVKKLQYPSAGNAEVRANFKKSKADYMARKAAAEERVEKRHTAHKDLYDPWGGYDEKKFFALQPDVKDSDKEKLLYNTRVFGDMPYGHDKADFENMKDFKRWVKEIGGDWDVVSDAFRQSRSAMSSAIANSYSY